MKVIEGLIQGSPEWHAHRLNHFNASDVPAMMGHSPYKTRAQFVKEVATGLGEEISPEQQKRMDDGHLFEKLARPLAEEILGQDLYPLVGTDGPYSASFDGLPMDDSVDWEHKSLNDRLRAVLPADGVGDESVGALLPVDYREQMVQQCAIAGCQRALFTASKWRWDSEAEAYKLVEARHCWYRPEAELWEQVVAGWKQFEADVAAYQPAEVAPVIVAEPVQALPAVLVQVRGEIAITANFGAFETALRDFLEHRLIREPKTDQDFADLDTQIKAMKGAEAALEAAEGQMLAQIASVDTAKKTKDMLHKLVRDNRLMAEKLLASEKERRKHEIVQAAALSLFKHVQALTERVGKGVMPNVPHDFPAVIKGKKSIASMEDAISTELARAKIEANRIADLIDGNRKAMDEADAGHLFPDFAQVCAKAAEDFANLITSRRAAAQARADAERERIRAEEAERLEREAAAKREAEERAQREAAAAREREEAQLLADSQRQQQEAEARVMVRESVKVAEAIGLQPAAPAPAPEVRTFTRAAAPSELPTLTLGEIKTRIAPLSIDAAGLESLGFPAKKERGACLYRNSDWPAIHAALVKKLTAAGPQQLAA